MLCEVMLRIHEQHIPYLCSLRQRQKRIYQRNDGYIIGASSHQLLLLYKLMMIKSKMGAVELVLGPLISDSNKCLWRSQPNQFDSHLLKQILLTFQIFVSLNVLRKQCAQYTKMAIFCFSLNISHLHSVHYICC